MITVKGTIKNGVFAADNAIDEGLAATYCEQFAEGDVLYHGVESEADRVERERATALLCEAADPDCVPGKLRCNEVRAAVALLRPR
jgi:hypothetical protein